MKTFVKHLLENNLEEILSRSLINCHVVGLHSIMLLESPGKNVRLFITDENHSLWQNEFADLDMMHPVLMPLAFHPHHCNLTLEGVFGNFTNWTVQPGNNYTNNTMNLYEYEYKSKITEGEMSFKLKRKVQLKTQNIRQIGPGKSIKLHANNIHTVIVAKGHIAAWFVYEGMEDENYQSLCYSNTPEELINVKNPILYQPMSENKLYNLLVEIGLR